MKRIKYLSKQFDNKGFRDSYLETRIKVLIATQIRNFRGERTQKEFSEILGVTQSVVSRWEDPDCGVATLQTLINIAIKLDKALVIEFSSWENYLNHELKKNLEDENGPD